MDSFSFYLGLILSTTTWAVLCWLPFSNITLKVENISARILKKEVPKDNDWIEYMDFLKSDCYKSHKKKWIKYCFVPVAVSVATYLAITSITKNPMISYLGATMLTSIPAGIILNKEDTERKRIKKEFHKTR